MLGCHFGHIEVVRKCLENEEDIHARYDDNQTPLVEAIDQGHEEIGCRSGQSHHCQVAR
jgi:ankyrin repeat protein